MEDIDKVDDASNVDDSHETVNKEEEEH